MTAGFLCERTSHFLERQGAPERFTRPMLRRDGRLEELYDRYDLQNVELGD